MGYDVLPSIDLLRESSDKELEAVIEESQQALLDIRTQAQFAPPEKPHLFKAHRKLIARCKSVLNERSQT